MAISCYPGSPLSKSQAKIAEAREGCNEAIAYLAPCQTLPHYCILQTVSPEYLASTAPTKARLESQFQCRQMYHIDHPHRTPFGTLMLLLQKLTKITIQFNEMTCKISQQCHVHVLCSRKKQIISLSGRRAWKEQDLISKGNSA